MIFSTMFLPTAILLPLYRSVYSMLGNGVSTVSVSKDRPMIRKAGGEINRTGVSPFRAPERVARGDLRSPDHPILVIHGSYRPKQTEKKIFLRNISPVNTRLSSENCPPGDAGSTHAEILLTPLCVYCIRFEHVYIVYSINKHDYRY